MKYASIGTISHATLRTEDLLTAFADELEYQVQRNAELPLKHRQAQIGLVNDAREVTDFDSEDASELIHELEAALNEYAAPYCYFGAHEGDGSDFGYWPDSYVIEELEQVQDSDQASALGQDCKFVNDHGNVTVFDGNGKVIAEFV